MGEKLSAPGIVGRNVRRACQVQKSPGRLQRSIQPKRSYSTRQVGGRSTNGIQTVQKRVRFSPDPRSDRTAERDRNEVENPEAAIRIKSNDIRLRTPNLSSKAFQKMSENRRFVSFYPTTYKKRFRDFKHRFVLLYFIARMRIIDYVVYCKPSDSLSFSSTNRSNRNDNRFLAMMSPAFNETRLQKQPQRSHTCN